GFPFPSSDCKKASSTSAFTPSGSSSQKSYSCSFNKTYTFSNTSISAVSTIIFTSSRKRFIFSIHSNFQNQFITPFKYLVTNYPITKINKIGDKTLSWIPLFTGIKKGNTEPPTPSSPFPSKDGVFSSR